MYVSWLTVEEEGKGVSEMVGMLRLPLNPLRQRHMYAYMDTLPSPVEHQHTRFGGGDRPLQRCQIQLPLPLVGVQQGHEDRGAACL